MRRTTAYGHTYCVTLDGSVSLPALGQHNGVKCLSHEHVPLCVACHVCRNIVFFAYM